MPGFKVTLSESKNQAGFWQPPPVPSVLSLWCHPLHGLSPAAEGASPRPVRSRSGATGTAAEHAQDGSRADTRWGWGWGEGGRGGGAGKRMGEARALDAGPAHSGPETTVWRERQHPGMGSGRQRGWQGS